MSAVVWPAWQSRSLPTGGQQATSPASLTSPPPLSAPTSPAARCLALTVGSAGSQSGGPRPSANGTPSDRGEPRAKLGQPDDPSTSRQLAQHTALHCRIAPYLIKAARYARRGPALAPASGLGGSPGRRAPALTPRSAAGQPGSFGTRRVLHGAVFLCELLSRSRPPRRGRSLRSRRTRSASPNLDPTSARQGSAPIEEDGADQDS